MIKYDLVLSSDTRHKLNSKNILLLGNWCKENSFYQKNYYKVAEPCSILHKIRSSDQIKVRNYEKELLASLSTSLNYVHSTDLLNSSWKIILGHWLRYLINTLLNRYNTIKNCLDNYEVSSVNLIKYKNFSLIPNDTLESVANYNNPIMDEFLFEQILNFINNKNIKINYIIDHSDRKELKSQMFCSLRKKNYGIMSLINDYVLSKIYRDEDIFVINSLLSLKDEVLLNIRLGNFPKIWRTKPVTYNNNPESVIRKKLLKKLKSNVKFNNQDKFKEILVDLIPKLIPICFMEGFIDLNSKVNALKWPKKPKCIYTCNSFAFDEVFKLWSSKKIQIGSKYIIGQHGNNYGTNRYKSPFIEEEIATEFVTWGSKTMFNSKKGIILRDHRLKRKKNTDKILFVTTHYPIRHDTWDETYEYEMYKKNQFSFIAQLDDCIKENLIIRLSKNSQIYFGKEEINKWKNFDNKLQIDNGFSKIKNLIKSSKVVIYDYDSTGMLECIGNNIPTMAYWSHGLDHLNESVLIDYRKLVDKGIIHTSPDSLAAMLNKNYYNLNDWWFSTEIQNIINEFRVKYANSQPNSVKKISEIICL